MTFMDVNPAEMADAPFYSSEHGEFLSSKIARLQEIIKDYNPYLEIVFIPTAQRDATDTHPFALMDRSPWRPAHIVRHLTEREMDDPQSLLAWIFEGDLSKHGLSEIMAKAQAKEFAEKLLDEKRKADIAAERKDLAAFMVAGGRNKLNQFRHNGKVFTDKGARNASSTVY